MSVSRHEEPESLALTGTDPTAVAAELRLAPGAPRQPREARRFLGLFLALVAGAVVLGLPLLNLLLLTWLKDPETRWIEELWQRKRALAKKFDGQPKIIIAGGSSALFSIDAELLHARLGRPVVNMASHARLGPRHLIDDARSVARPGDTILLHLEYQQLAHMGGVFVRDRKSMFAHEPLRMVRLPWPILFEGAYAIPYSEYFEGWTRRNDILQPQESMRPFHGRGFVNLSPNGDLRVKEEPYGSTITPVPPKPAASLDLEGEAYLREVVQWARAKQIQLLAVRPAMLRDPLTSPEICDAAYAKAGEVYTKFGIRLLDSRVVYQVPREYMLDTVYHASPAGRRIITEVLLRELRKVPGLAKRMPKEEDAAHPPVLLVAGMGNSHGDALVLGRQEVEGRYLAAADLQHPLAITPAQVRALQAEGRRIWCADPEGLQLLESAGIAIRARRHGTTELAQWWKKYRDSVILLAAVRGFPTAPLAEGVPEPAASFLRLPAPCKAGVFGSGRWAHVNLQATDPERLLLERSRYTRFARQFPRPFSFTLFSSKEPGHNPPPSAAGAIIRIDEDLAEREFQAGLAATAVDPLNGRVIHHALFLGPMLEEWTLSEVVIPGKP